MRTISTSFLIFILTIQWARATDKATAPDFSVYPQTDAFRSDIGLQTNTAWSLHYKNLLVISAFCHGFTLEYFVNESGEESDVREVYDWAGQASHGKQLSEVEIKGLRSAIEELPVESSMPPLNRLLVVSFRQGTNVVTRSYDRQALPSAVHRIFDIIGEKFETKGEKWPEQSQHSNWDDAEFRGNLNRRAAWDKLALR